MIELHDIWKTYDGPRGEVHALRGVSLSVAAGEFVAVRGPSGCGKSTLLMIAGGLARPSSGRAMAAGVDLAAASGATLSRFRAENVGFVFQMFHLLPYLSVGQNVAAAALPPGRATAMERAEQLLCRFGLGHRLHHRPAELSAGERQRAAIARAMLNEPALILADEPTGNLDADSAAGVLDLLVDYQRGGGTVLLVTHSEQAAAQAGRVVSLLDGEVAALANPSAMR
jgi:ABC-type lipoprotein export system ATPase subunit